MAGTPLRAWHRAGHLAPMLPILLWLPCSPRWILLASDFTSHPSPPSLPPLQLPWPQGPLPGSSPTRTSQLAPSPHLLFLTQRSCPPSSGCCCVNFLLNTCHCPLPQSPPPIFLSICLLSMSVLTAEVLSLADEGSLEQFTEQSRCSMNVEGREVRGRAVGL